MEGKLLKFDFTEIEEYGFRQYKSPISANNIDINKIVVCNKFPFGKKDFKYFISYKDPWKLDLWSYSLHKWLNIKEILMNLDVFIF